MTRFPLHNAASIASMAPTTGHPRADEPAPVEELRRSHMFDATIHAEDEYRAVQELKSLHRKDEAEMKPGY